MGCILLVVGQGMGSREVGCPRGGQAHGGRAN